MIPGRIAALALVVVLLAGVGIGVAATRDSGDDVETGAPSAVDQAGVTTSTEPATTTTVDLAPSTSTPPTTRTGSPSTTVRRTTTTAPRVATTRAPASTTTTKAAAVPTCVPAHIAVAITTDRPSYAPGQVVTATSTLRNKSSTTCFYNGYNFTSAFRDEAGHSFGGATVIADSFADVALRPGEAITHSAPWDHKACPEAGCASLPAGVYTAVGTWKIGPATYEVSTTMIFS